MIRQLCSIVFAVELWLLLNLLVGGSIATKVAFRHGVSLYHRCEDYSGPEAESNCELQHLLLNFTAEHPYLPKETLIDINSILNRTVSFAEPVAGDVTSDQVVPGYGCIFEKKKASDLVATGGDEENLLRVLRCNGLTSADFPHNFPSLFTTAQILDFGKNSIKSVNLTRILETFPEAEILDFKDNNISTLHIERMGPIYDKVRVIDFEQNQLTTLEPHLFQAFPSLQQLYLPNNKIKQLPAQLFQNNAKIEAVSFSNNRIKQVPSGFFNFTHRMTRLYIGNNELSTIDEALGPCLEELSINGNKIQSIPPDIFSRHPNLTFADVSSNNLERLSINWPVNLSPVMVFEDNPSVRWEPESYKRAVADDLIFPGTQTSCMEGTRMDEKFRTCVECELGTYSNDGIECIPCEANQIVTKVGAFAFEECPHHLAATLDHAGCMPQKCGETCFITLAIGSFLPFLVLTGSLISAKLVQSDRKLNQARQMGMEEGRKEKVLLTEGEIEAIKSSLQSDERINRAYIPYDQIEEGKIISSGSFGEVLSGHYCGSKVAIKRMLPYRISSEEVSMFAREVHLMMTLRHPHIIQFIGVSWSSSLNLCVLTEYMENGDLFNVLSTNHHLDFSWKRFKFLMAYESAQGLAYLHNQDPVIIHRDLKSRNILVSDTMRCKISDFGCSRESIENDDTMTVAGTNLWLAPEMIRCERFNEKSDCFSFGIVLVEMLNHELPYYNAFNSKGEKLGGMQLLHEVAYKNKRPDILEEVYCPDTLRELINECLSSSPEKRPSAIEIVHRLKTTVKYEVMNNTVEKDDIVQSRRYSARSRTSSNSSSSRHSADSRRSSRANTNCSRQYTDTSTGSIRSPSSMNDYLERTSFSYSSSSDSRKLRKKLSNDEMTMSKFTFDKLSSIDMNQSITPGKGDSIQPYSHTGSPNDSTANFPTNLLWE